MFCVEILIVDGNVLFVLRTADGRVIKGTSDLEVIKSELSSIGDRWLQDSKKSESDK